MIPLPGEFGAVNFAVVAVTGVTVPLDAVHVTPAPVSFVTVAVSVATWPTANPPTLDEIVTLTPPALAVEIVIIAIADFVVSATDVAVNVTIGGLGATPGAVYTIGVPEALVAADKPPHVAPPHSAPARVHVTPSFEGSPVTVAVKVVVAFTATVAVVCDNVTETPAGGADEPIVIVAEADFVPSLTDVAAIVTVAGFGVVAGAAYVTAVPDALEVAETEPHPFAVAQESAHVTPLFALSLETVAVNICVFPTTTVAVTGVTLTPIGGEPPPPLVVELPPQPATNVTKNAATTHIVRRPRCLCARSMTLLRLLASLYFFSRLPGNKKAASLHVLHIIAADTLRQVWCSPLLSVPGDHAAVGNRDFHRTTALLL
ncbi:MAG TPA: hypothetical protein VN933_13175 [Candidatus Eremiobacteraceae bacterium]|nr:hypothetical protein [Candidatus Eremiobacteraceae bacterium]